MKIYLNSIFFVLLCCLSASNGFSQQTIEQKKELADKYFVEGKFGLAEPLYAAVIADNPRNHDLNFRYGTCLIYGSKDKEEAIKRLRFSITIPSIDVCAYYYLGRAYHLNYQFNEALKHYTKFKELATLQDLKVLKVAVDIEACNFGKKLLANVTNMIVIQKTELKSDKFYDLYKLDDIGGQLLVTSEFQTKLDKKMEHRPIIHFPSNSPYIYYSSYGEDGLTGLDIYVKKKLPGGEWSNAQKVKGHVNTAENEDFAYMHPHRDYLYFSSKGHNSMGGYDVFRSKYNPDDDSFGPPENMDFAISSPDDDVLFIVDSLNRVAYFSSARESGEGKLMVYKVRVERIPMQMAVIKGNFLNTIDKNSKGMEIVIEDFSNGREIGKFNTKTTNGDYFITFPKSGKYNFYMTVNGSNETHLAPVEIPYFKDFRPLKQQLTLSLDGNSEEQILVENLFNDPFDDPSAVMAEVFRELSKLPPNAASYNLDSLDDLRKTDEIFVELGLDVFLTAEDLTNSLSSKADNIQQSIGKDEQASNIAYNLSQQKSNTANAKMVELNKLIQASEGANEKDKILHLQNAAKLQNEIQHLNSDALNLLDLAAALDKDADKKKQELLDVQKVLKDIKSLPKENRDALIAAVENNKDYFLKNANQKTEVSNPLDQFIKESNAARKESQKSSEELSAIIAQKSGLINDNKRLQQQLEASKKQKDKDAFQLKIDANNSEIAMLDKQAAERQKDSDKYRSTDKIIQLGELAQIVSNTNDPALKEELTAKDKERIAADVKQKDLTEDLRVVDELISDNKVSKFNIDLYANNEQTEGFTMLEWTKAIDGEQERLKLERDEATVKRRAEIDAEIERLEKLRAEKDAEFTVVEVGEGVIIPTINPNDIVKDYTQKKESIGEIVNEENRRIAQIELNVELADELDRERKKLEVLSSQNSKDKIVKERLANLNIIANELKIEIDKDKKWLADNEDVPFDKNNIVENLAPNYQQKINKAYEILDENKRKNEINAINSVLLEKANERVQELSALIEGDENNVKAKEERSYLQAFIEEVGQNKEIALLAPVTLDVKNLSAKPNESELIIDFNTQKAQIESISNEFERRTAENILYKNLNSAINAELAELNRLAVEHPSNKDIQKRKAKLIDLQGNYQAKFDDNKRIIDNNKPKEESLLVNTAPNTKDIFPLYDEQLASIENSELSPTEKNQKTILLKTELVDGIEKELNLIEEQLTLNPAAEDDLLKRKMVLEELKDETRNALRVLENEDAANTDVIPRTELTIESIMTLYTSKMADIQNSAGDKNDVLKKENELNQTFLSLVEFKRKELVEEGKNNPSSLALVEKDLAQLSAIEKQKNEAIISNNSLLSLESPSVESRPAVNVSAVMPDFDEALSEIRNSGDSDVEKMQAENVLQERLLKNITTEIDRLNAEKMANPSLASVIDTEISTYKDLERSARNQLQLNKDRIAEEKSTELKRPTITISLLLKDFDQRMAEIQNSKAPEIEKIKATNKLNNELLLAIDNKLAAIQVEWEADPIHGYIYKEEISKLEELKESKRSEIAKTDEEIEQLSNESIDRATSNSEDLGTKGSGAQLNDLIGGKEEIKRINQELESLNKAQLAAESDKEKQKIQKEIDKKTSLKTNLENQAIQDLSIANAKEIAAAIDEVEKLKNAGKGNVGISEDLATAEANIEQAKQNVLTANTLRNEAAGLKDSEDKNKKLKEALTLEMEAKALITETKRIYKMAKVQDKYAAQEEVITRVPENLEDRASTNLMNESFDLTRAADKLEIRAQELRDSSLTVKKKHRESVVEQADVLTLKANELRTEADESAAKASEIKRQEDELLAVKTTPIGKVVSAKETETITTSELYEKFVADKNKGDEKMQTLSKIDDQVAELEDRKTRRIKMAVVKYADGAEDELENDAELTAIQTEIDSLKNLQKELKKAAIEDYTKANESIAALSAEEQESMNALQQKGVEPKKIDIAVNVDFAMPDKIETSIFRKTEGAVYSEGAPIPIDQNVTSGLVYKVQVGAFRNPLPQDHFKEFAPISGQKLNNGITRYMVGYFQTFAPAFSAKTQVNEMGYGDAFVVAYCNGERITIDRAKLIEEGLITCDEKQVTTPVGNNEIAVTNNTGQNQGGVTTNTTAGNQNTSNQNTSNQNTTSQTTGTTNNTSTIFGGIDDHSATLINKATTPEEAQLIEYYTVVPNAAKANQVEIIKGLFYTVQIGVYSKPVPLSSLFNIQPLNSQRTESGVIRYSTGIFTSEDAAAARKQAVVQAGIADAFVTAYFDGERITMEQALEVLKKEGADAFVGKKESNLEGAKVDDSSESTEVFKEVFHLEGLYYRILLGKYQNSIPGEYATILLQGDNVLETEVDQEGRTCITSPKIASFEKVLDKIKEFSDMGIEDMEIVTFYKYDVIPFAEGQKIQKQEHIDMLHPYEDMKGVSANSFLYNANAIYFRIKLGVFEERVPTDFTNLFLLHEQTEGINKEESIDDEIIFVTNSIQSWKEAEEAKKRLVQKGFVNSQIIAFHKYDEISVEKAKEVIGQ